MRVEDVIPASDICSKPYGSSEPDQSHTGASPLDDLILARATGMLATCHLLARDEAQLVGVVINNLDADPHYQPSETLMAAIQAINRKFARCQVRVLT